MGKRYTQDFVIEQFKKVHGEKYDYSLVNYKKDGVKVKIICPIHGEFLQTPMCHKKKQGCYECGRLRIGPLQMNSKEKFIDRINKIHPDSFNFEKTIYQGAHKKLIVTCIKCKKDNIVSPSDLYKIRGCNYCFPRYGLRLEYENIIDRCNKIHDNKYNYSLIKGIINQKSPIDIICPKHGIFTQTINEHLYGGSGCQLCKGSKGELKILNLLNTRKVKYYYQYKVRIDNSNHYFDFYLPDHNLVIEYNGKQHYEPIKFFGGDKVFKNVKKRDRIKKKFCLGKSIDICYIKYNEFKQIEEILNKYL